MIIINQLQGDVADNEDCKDTYHEYGAVDNNYIRPHFSNVLRQLTDQKDPSQKAIAAVHNDQRQ